jgi:putative ABC transport system substrate-binding protein
MIRRREFITVVGGAAAAWPLAARAQQPAMPVVGFLRDATAAESEFMVNGLRKGLAEAGFVEGHNFTIDYAWSEGQSVQLSTLAAELVGRNVSVIVSSSNNATFAAKAATSTIPVVFAINNDPVASGLVASLNRPGGNLTGVSYLTSELGAKRLGLMHEMVPRVTDFAVLAHRVSARGLGALLIAGNTLFTSRREHISVLAARYALPTMYTVREFANAGGLICYGANLTDAYRLVGGYAGRILKGEKPADLPVMQPTKFELVKTAKALGLEVPDRLLALADEVFE